MTAKCRKAIDLALLPKKLQRTILKMAVEAAWGYIEFGSLLAREGNTEWMNVSGEPLRREIEMIEALGLLERHPDHADWVRAAKGVRA